MNENSTMKRVAELMDMHEVKEQARRSVANDVLVFLDPENCREMALGVADVLQNADMDGWTTDAVARTGQAISTLLRVADMQENAEAEAKAKDARKAILAEQAKDERRDLLRNYVAGSLPESEAAKLEATITDDEISELRQQAEHQTLCWHRMIKEDEATLCRLDALEAGREADHA